MQRNYEHLQYGKYMGNDCADSGLLQTDGIGTLLFISPENMAGNFENVGCAAPGKAGVYNILIMEEKQTIMALGAGAMTKFVLDHGSRIERVENVKDVTNYLERIDEMIERKRREMEEIQWL